MKFFCECLAIPDLLTWFSKQAETFERLSGFSGILFLEEVRSKNVSLHIGLVLVEIPAEGASESFGSILV